MHSVNNEKAQSFPNIEHSSLLFEEIDLSLHSTVRKFCICNFKGIARAVGLIVGVS